LLYDHFGSKLSVLIIKAFNNQNIKLIPDFPPRRGCGLPVVDISSLASEGAVFPPVNIILNFLFNFNALANLVGIDFELTPA
jgi:hypothetical protein